MHNVTSASRLFDVLPAFTDDWRVQTVFTCTGSSAFVAGTAEFLATQGVEVLPWKRALKTKFDLAISASYGGDLHKIRAPLVVVPHGMGYNKYLETGNRKPETGNRKPETGNRKPVFGLDPQWIMHDGVVVPNRIVLSHPEQLDRLRAACPEALSAAIVAGDPCFDRLLLSRPLRESYRQALGLTGGQRLVLVTSTWGGSSLYGTEPELPFRLATRLPADAHRIVIALHPNIRHGHSPWQLARWQERCARAGIAVLPDEAWRAGVLAADLTIGDHGSVTFYSAALGTPILLAAAPTDAVDPRSPIGLLLDAAPRLDRHTDPLTQIERTIAGHDTARYRPITDLGTSLPGRSVDVLHTEFYRMLELPEPDAPPVTTTLPLPETALPKPSALLAHAELDGDAHATITRYVPGALADPAHLPAGTHLVVGTDEPNTRLLDLADVLVHDRPVDARAWIAATARALPGCALFFARQIDGGWLLGTHGGELVRCAAVIGDPGPFASLLLAWLAAGRGIADLPSRISVTLAGETRTASVTVLALT